MIEWWGPVIHEYYAGTEGNGFVYCNSEGWLAHPGTVGSPLNCVVHVVGEDGEEVPTGESGTIYFEAGGTFEYHNDPGKRLARGIQRAGAHLVTSATSMMMVSCSSPIERRT